VIGDAVELVNKAIHVIAIETLIRLKMKGPASRMIRMTNVMQN
jgi:hypothetical protein